MNNRFTNHATMFVFLALFAAGGCSSTHGEKMVQSFTKTREILAKSQGQVDMTLLRLNNVRTAPPDAVKEAYRQYKEAVTRLEEEGANAQWRAQTMKDEGDAYIKAWQEEMKSITDPKIKASLESRREAVRTNFKLIRMYADDARKAYEPFVRGNKEIVQALSIDLSPAGLNSLAPAIDGVMGNGQALKQSIAAMQNALDNIADGKSAIGL